MDNELWLPITEWENCYAVSNMGRVKSLRFKNGTFPGRILRAGKKRNGYVAHNLRNGKRNVHISVHRLVASAFLFPVEGKSTINHKNGIKTDNRADNLEWVSPKENTAHSIHVLGKSHKGEASGMAKMTDALVIQLREMYAETEFGYGRLATMFDINRITVRDIVKRRTWRHI